MSAQQPVGPEPFDPQPLAPQHLDPQPSNLQPLSPQPPAPPQTTAPTYVTGPNFAAIVLGLVCVVAGALTIVQVTAGLVIDWSHVGPGVFTGLGVLFVVIGAFGIGRRRRRT
ncbi:MAG: hypothetical protein IPK37_02580 [Austwickia sp.]|nr:MAG: hypothetical protein IPK37_02580 [Austwickia sp.]